MISYSPVYVCWKCYQYRAVSEIKFLVRVKRSLGHNFTRQRYTVFYNVDAERRKQKMKFNRSSANRRLDER